MLFPRKLTALNGDKFIAQSDTRGSCANENLSSQDTEAHVSLRQWKHLRGGEDCNVVLAEGGKLIRLFYFDLKYQLEYLKIRRKRGCRLALRKHEVKIALHL